MKKYSLLAIAFMCVFSSKAATMLLEGKYQNKNLFVQNVITRNGVGFCATEVKVNGNISTDEVNSSAFEIDLSSYKLNVGDKVTIEIVHKDDCAPKVLNPDALKPKPTFEVTAISVTTTGTLSWSATGENGTLPYVIEQYKWNKWVPVGEVTGKGTAGKNDYTFQVLLTSGNNKFRVKQSGLGGIVKVSKEATIANLIEKPSYVLNKEASSVQFSFETAYEMFDIYGNVVKKGFGKEIQINNLGKGKYYLCYDNQMTELDKKR